MAEIVDDLPQDKTPIVNPPKSKVEVLFDDTFAKYKGDGNSKTKGIAGDANVYLDTGIGDSQYDKGIRPDVELDPLDFVKSLQEHRARKQPVGHQLANGAIKTIVGIPLGVVGNVASMLDFEDYNNSDEELGNWLTDLTLKAKEGMNETFTNYRENPGEAFDLGDSAWWIDNTFGLAESMGSFAISGGLLGKALMGLSRLSKIQKIATGIKGLNTNVAEFGGKAFNTGVTALALNQAEGIIEADEVMKELYKVHTEAGISDKEARQRAVLGGATVINTNRLNVLFNLTSAGLFTRGSNLTRNVIKNPNSLQNYGRGLMEGGQESIEEAINLISGKRGLAYGKGESYSFADVVNDLSTAEAAEAAVLGFVGGMGQTVLTTEGVNRFNKTGDPDNPGQKISVRDYNIKQYKKYKAAVEEINAAKSAHDVSGITDAFESIANRMRIHQQIETARDEGDHDRVEELSKLSVANAAMNAFRNGTTGNLIEMFKEFGAGPQREGMGEDYKERAAEAISLIKHLEKEYTKSYDYHGSSLIYQNRAGKFIKKQTLDKLKAEKAEADIALANEVARRTEGTNFDSADRGVLFFEETSDNPEFIKVSNALKSTEEYKRTKELEGKINDVNEEINSFDDKYAFLTNDATQKEFSKIKKNAKKEAEEKAKEAAKKAKEEKKKAKEEKKNKNKNKSETTKEPEQPTTETPKEPTDEKVLGEISEELEKAANETYAEIEKAKEKAKAAAELEKNEEDRAAENAANEQKEESELAKLIKHRAVGDTVPIPFSEGTDYEGMSGVITDINEDDEIVTIKTESGEEIKVHKDQGGTEVMNIIPKTNTTGEINTEGGNDPTPVQPQSEEDNSTQSGSEDGLKIISKTDTGEPLDWFAEQSYTDAPYNYLNYEVEPTDKRGVEVGVKIVPSSSIPYLTDDRKKAVNIYNKKLTGNKRQTLSQDEIEHLALHLPLIAEFTEEVFAPFEARPVTDDAIANFNKYVLPTRRKIINALVEGKTLADITLTVKDQYHGLLQVAPKENGEVVENSVLDLQQVEGKAENVELFVVNETTGLVDAYNSTVARGFGGPGEIYMKVRRADGSPFYLKLNVKRSTELEAEVLFNLYKAILGKGNMHFTSLVKDMDVDTVSFLKDSLKQEIELFDKAGKTFDEITIGELINFLVYDNTNNAKTRIKVSNGKLVLGTNRVFSASTLDQKKDEFISFFTDVKRRNIKFKSNPDALPFNASNLDYVEYLLKNKILNTNAKVGVPLFQGRTHIYLSTEVKIAGKKAEPLKQKVVKEKVIKAMATKSEKDATAITLDIRKKFQPQIDERISDLVKAGKSRIMALKQAEEEFAEILAKEYSNALGIDPTTPVNPTPKKVDKPTPTKKTTKPKGTPVQIIKDAKSNWKLEVMADGKVINANTGKEIDNEALINKAHLKSGRYKYSTVDIKVGKNKQTYAVTDDGRIINVTPGSKANGNAILATSSIGAKVLDKASESIFNDVDEDTDEKTEEKPLKSQKKVVPLQKEIDETTTSFPKKKKVRDLSKLKNLKNKKAKQTKADKQAELDKKIEDNSNNTKCNE
jgi:hypothetical protein